MKIQVLKFGGSVLENIEKVKEIAKLIIKKKKEGIHPIVVVSAFKGTTNKLKELALQITKNPPERELDMLLSVGERISMSLLSMAINSMGEKAISFTGSQIGIITTNDHTNAKVIEVRPFRLIEAIKNGKIPVVAGFQGVSLKKEITTLGIGGSDVTAVSLSIALGVKECVFYKNYSVCFTDPLFCPSPHIPTLPYKYALLLTYFGAKFLHPRAISIAQKFSIKLKISTLKEDKITMIENKKIEKPKIVGISIKTNVKLFEEKSRINEVLKKQGIILKIEGEKITDKAPEKKANGNFVTIVGNLLPLPENLIDLIKENFEDAKIFITPETISFYTEKEVKKDFIKTISNITF